MLVLLVQDHAGLLARFIRIFRPPSAWPDWETILTRLGDQKTTVGSVEKHLSYDFMSSKLQQATFNKLSLQPKQIMESDYSNLISLIGLLLRFDLIRVRAARVHT